MATLILVLGDQLTPSLPVLSQADKANDRVLLAEVKEEATYVKHHKKKIAFLGRLSLASFKHEFQHD